MPVVIGVVLLIAGCGGIGLMAFTRLINRVRLLTEFSFLCDRLASEIGFRMTPLAELPQRIPSLTQFWEEMGYRPYGEESYAEAWKRATDSLDVSKLDRSLIGSIGEVLGQYDAENQVRSLGVIRKQLELSLAAARDNRQKYGRLYGLLGLLGGLLLAVILI